MLKKRPLALSLCLFAIGCTVNQESEVTATNSSAMVELLNSIRNNPDVESNSFLNDDRIIWMQKKIIHSKFDKIVFLPVSEPRYAKLQCSPHDTNIFQTK